MSTARAAASRGGRPGRLPTGTVTFLRTDVEGSMRLALTLGSRWDELNAAQLAVGRTAVEEHSGVVVRTEGDACFASFPDAAAAALAAVDILRRLDAATWARDAAMRVRVGLHTGEAHLAGDDYGGFDVNRAARIAAVAHGGQVVLSDTTRALIITDLPVGTSIRDLGRHLLKDVPQPEHLFQLVVGDLPDAFPPLRTAQPARTDLPARLTSFVGRDADLDELTRLLERARLLTITGPGGIGKSSVAIELARAHTNRYPDGVYFVPLAAVADPALVPSVIGAALALFGGHAQSAIEGVTQFLAPRTVLLVLDSLEHLLPAATDVAALLRAAPGLTVLATSRAPLHVTGEQEYALGPLPVGPLSHTDDATDGADAIRLFVERARAARVGWDPGPDASIVEEICRRLDGLPLGIELAAARVALLPPAVIRDRLAARLPLPGAGPRDLPDRQQTLDRAIAWSHDLLDEPHQRLLRELGAFEGGFDLDQVRLVATEPVAGGDPLDGLVALADQSLIARDPAPTVSGLGTVRFRLLETVRSFALDRLEATGSADDVRRRHAEAYLALAEAARRFIPGPDQPRWLDRLAEDDDNLRAAVDFAIATGNLRLAHRLAAALWRYWQLDGRLHFGRRAAEAILAMPGGDEPTPELAWFLGAAGSLAYWQADTPRADALYEEQVRVARQVGDRAAEADGTFNLASTQFIRSGFVSAGDLLDRARVLYAELGDEVGEARVAWSMSNARFMTASPDELLEEVTALRERFARNRDSMYEALAIGSEAWVNFFARRSIPAARATIETLARNHALRDRATTTISLQEGAIALMELGRAPDAAVVIGAWEELCRVHGVQPPGGLQLMILTREPMERLSASLPPDVMDTAQARGRQMTLDEAVAFTLDRLEAAVAAASGDSDGPPARQ